jgi:uncharacterized protein (DUF433 family)
MPQETQASDLSAEVQELRKQVEEMVATLKGFLALPRPSPSPFNPFLNGGWPSYPLPQDSPPFWAWLEAGLSEPTQEHPVEGFTYLVSRTHPWRRQPYLKGRNLTVRQLVGTVRSNQWDEVQAAGNLDLPVEAIREALRYAEENRELLDFEAAYERLILACGGDHSGTFQMRTVPS